MDRCISHKETSDRRINRSQAVDTASPWDRFDLADNTSFTARRRRSTSPAFALSPLSSPSSSYYGDDLGSPEAADDSGCNPVENLSSLYINDTWRSRRSLGSNASSHRSSSSNGSAESASSWSQPLPYFHRPLKFVSRPPDLPFAAVPSQLSPAKPGDQAAAGQTTPRGGVRRRNRRNPSFVVEDADRAAFDKLVGHRRVGKSFLFGKKSTNSRRAINSILTTSDQQAADDDDTGRFRFDQAGLPPVDYVQTVSARSAEGWHVASRLKSTIALLPRLQDGRQRQSTSYGREATPSDGKESPVDVEMRSKTPSRESSFRSDEAEATTAAKEAGGDATNVHNDDSTPSHGEPVAVKVENVGGEPGGTAGRTAANRPTPAAATSDSVDSKKRVYGCTVPDCGKVYTKSSHLKSHMRSHTGWWSQTDSEILSK